VKGSTFLGFGGGASRAVLVGRGPVGGRGGAAAPLAGETTGALELEAGDTPACEAAGAGLTSVAAVGAASDRETELAGVTVVGEVDSDCRVPK
jgi:hypothetical protein